MTTFRVDKISKRFGALEVLRHISLAFEPGTVTAIVGDNGAGKSTLLKILAGMYRPETGFISLGDTQIANQTAEFHRRCGIEMVYQDLALAGRQDVVTNIFAGREKTTCVGLLDRKYMAREAKSLMDRLGIHIPKLSSAVGLLSGGQQQAIAIARAVMFSPKVLLLDEPTAALAAREVDKTLELIRQQRKEMRTTILVSHRLNDVLAVSDRIVVLKHGVVFSDDPSSTLTLGEVVERIVS